MYIVVVGDVVNGFQFYGPFPTYDDAVAWAVNCSPYNRVVKLRKPKA